MAATTPPSPDAPTLVTCGPRGTGVAPGARWPRGARPSSLALAGWRPEASTKTRALGSNSGIASRPAARGRGTSARAWSVA
jgi:hypothetical protein